MIIKDCSHCGGTHYGSLKCPYICERCGNDIRPDETPRCECPPIQTTQPDRQNGDGLPALADRFPEINPGNYDDHDVEALNNWGIEVVTEIRATPQPARDAAEREFLELARDMDRFANKHLGLTTDKGIARRAAAIFRRLAAPPKPAPDAMREAIIDECAKIAAGHNGISARDSRDIAKRIRALGDQRPRCSLCNLEDGACICAHIRPAAPVPPADGALAERFTKWVEQYAAKVCPPGCLPLPAQEREISLFAEIVRALSPSGTGAAEPVAWQPGKSIEDRARDLLEVELNADPAQPTVAAIRAIAVALQGELTCIDALRAVWDDWIIANDEAGMDDYEIKDVSPETVQKVQGALRGRLYATPPVRGDREARRLLRELEEACDRLAETRSQATYDAMIKDGQKDLLYELDKARHAAIDFLSLPVQPGAGERE